MRFYKPHYGQERKIIRFAWYPMKINNCVYWLEWITVHQTYRYGWQNDWVCSK